jgi:hypothetical protein
MVDASVTRGDDVPRPRARRRRGLSSMSLANLADTFNTSLGILVAALARPQSQGVHPDRTDQRSPTEMGSQQEDRVGALSGRMLSLASGRLTWERIESGLAAADRELDRTRRRCRELEALIGSGRAFLATVEVNTEASFGPREDDPVRSEPRTIGAR